MPGDVADREVPVGNQAHQACAHDPLERVWRMHELVGDRATERSADHPDAVAIAVSRARRPPSVRVAGAHRMKTAEDGRGMQRHPGVQDQPPTGASA